MTYFDDLTPYCYDRGDTEMLNVGWLSSAHTFPTGAIKQQHFEALLVLADNQQNLTRGTHDCDLCGLESPVRFIAPASTRGYVSCGMGEIHVTASDGQAYAAPSLVLHYIRNHGYLPPTEFLSALDEVEGPQSAAVADALPQPPAGGGADWGAELRDRTGEPRSWVAFAAQTTAEADAEFSAWLSYYGLVRAELDESLVRVDHVRTADGDLRRYNIRIELLWMLHPH